MKILTNWIKERSTIVLFLGPIFFAMLISYVIINIGKMIYPDGLPALFLQISGMFVFFLFGCAGVVLVARKEWPTMTWISLKGNPALIIGIIWIVFWWGLATMGLLKAIQIILKH
jgi:hypothetical protein